MLKHPPTVAELLRLDDIEGTMRRPESKALWYLFRLDGLLPDGQRLAIDVISGVTQVCTAGSVSTIVAETRMNELESCLVTALVLSHPYYVARYQMRALSQLHEGIEVKDQ